MNFIPFALSKIDPDKILPGDIYVKIQEKFIKYKNYGDVLSAEKYNLFIHKNVVCVYVEASGFKIFEEWYQKSRETQINQLVEELGRDNLELITETQQTGEMVFQTFAPEELVEEQVAQLQAQSEKIINLVKARKDAQNIMMRLGQYNQSIVDHSLRVANTSVMLAMILEHGHQFVLENVYMGALFHDYGKAKISPTILENLSDARYTTAIHNHPTGGMMLLKKMKNIPDQVLRIVAEHHEQYNGQGFPKGLREADIYGLSQVVALANALDHFMVKNQGKQDLPKHLLKYLQYDRGKQFDPGLIEKVIGPLEKIFSLLKTGLS